jgi:hypothetical protein
MKLESASMLREFVDQQVIDSGLLEATGKRQTGRACANDENIGVFGDHTGSSRQISGLRYIGVHFVGHLILRWKGCPSRDSEVKKG